MWAQLKVFMPDVKISHLPLQAVCCAEESHCCPVGYGCDESRTSCVKEDVVIPWYTKIPAATSVPADPSSVQCDALNNCPEHTSCCKLFTGEWGCCPLPNVSLFVFVRLVIQPQFQKQLGCCEWK